MCEHHSGLEPLWIAICVADFERFQNTEAPAIPFVQPSYMSMIHHSPSDNLIERGQGVCFEALVGSEICLVWRHSNAKTHVKIRLSMSVQPSPWSITMYLCTVVVLLYSECEVKTSRDYQGLPGAMFLRINASQDSPTTQTGKFR